MDDLFLKLKKQGIIGNIVLAALSTNIILFAPHIMCIQFLRRHFVILPPDDNGMMNGMMNGEG